jgi:hypothetical protein
MKVNVYYVYSVMKTDGKRVERNTRSHPGRIGSLACVAVLSVVCAQISLAADAGGAKAAGTAGEFVPLKLVLPAPAFKGTPKDIEIGPNVEPLSDKPRPPIMVPPGLKNIALGKKVTCGDKNAMATSLAKITDGNKDASDDSIIFLHKGLQWVQVDLGAPQEIFAIVLWHAHNTAKVYHDVVVQVADDPDFTKNVRTLFNNDQANNAGLGEGTDREYFETNEGKLINTHGVIGRYLRFYSKGSTESALNEYTEIEVYGR